MWKGLGIVLLLSGTAGVLYSWIDAQRESQKRLENIIFFLHKSVYAMQTEKIRVVDLFERYIEHDKWKREKKDIILAQILNEIRQRLLSNTYANGQMVWEEVFKEKEEKLHFDNEVFPIIVQAGNGFFGRTREENIRFLEKSINELEVQQKKLKVKSEQERKVWIPVGMLGSVMLVLLFI